MVRVRNFNVASQPGFTPNGTIDTSEIGGRVYRIADGRLESVVGTAGTSVSYGDVTASTVNASGQALFGRTPSDGGGPWLDFIPAGSSSGRSIINFLTFDGNVPGPISDIVLNDRGDYAVSLGNRLFRSSVGTGLQR